MTRIIPKITASPRLTRNSDATAAQAWIRIARARSIPAAPAGSDLHVDDILLVGVRVRLEIAHGSGVERRLLREGLQHLEAVVRDLGEMHVERDVVRLRVDHRLPRRTVILDAALERLDDLHAVDRVRLLDAGGPELEAGVGAHRQLAAEIGRLGAELRLEL